MAITSAPAQPHTYYVWVTGPADPPQIGLAWRLHMRHCDPSNPLAARRAAHAHAALLRRYSNDIYVAVRPAGSCPPPLGSQVLRD